MTAASVALALSVACCSCGSSAPTVATVRQQFLGVVSATNATLLVDGKSKNPVKTNATYAVAFRHAASQIHALQFPVSMRHDADALVTALNTMATLATEVSKAAAKPQSVEKNVVKMADINLKLIEEEKTEKTDSDKLRHDLGLPPEATTTTTTATTTPNVLGTPEG
jgi:hypothetical protein